MRQPRPDDDDAELHELVRAGPPDATDAPAALAHVIDQANREAAANRAQARELIKALDGVQRSQEFLGTALREERAKSRWLVALAFVLPVAAAVGAWLVWSHVDASKSEMDARLARLAAEYESARADAAAQKSDGRVAELTTDLDAVRRDLDASRDQLAAERKQLAEREAALNAAQSRSDGARTEIGALEFEVKSAKSKTAAAEARGSVIEARLRELQAQLAAASRPAPPPVTVAPAAAAAEGAPAAAPPEPAPAAVRPAPSKATPADAAEAAKARAILNALLKESGDAVHYQFAELGGIDGKSLTGVRLVGTDDNGAVIRTIQAARAEISADETSSTVVLRFTDGKLLVGAIEAPFFDGTYGLIVVGDPRKWRASGLSCVK